MRLSAAFILLPCLAWGQQAEPVIIPRPVEMTLTGGTCPLECPWAVEGDETTDPALVALLRSDLHALRPIPDALCETPFRIILDRFTPDTLLPPEWYGMHVETGRILLHAPTDEGLFRGTRTLLQLLEQGRSTGSIPCLTITDHPRFPWRGMHLDVCRHFFPVEFVKKYIDLLARYKMNTFHWHLTEDQGWRIEVKKYPKLTEVGAWRNGSQTGPYAAQTFDTLRYGGFYTQDEVREVVAYAAARHITVVPEIEMPGHAMAALASYPHLGCTGGPYEVQRGWGVFDDVFCAGNDSVFTFLEDVLSEVMGLFPGEYVHIGGDECPKTRWKGCPKCQARMKAEGLKDEHELQSYFIRRIERFVDSKGRKTIGWDEILEGGLAPNAAVMSWRGTEGGIAAAKAGHDAVMSPGSHCYFDHYQGDPANEPVAIGGHTTVQKVYGYEPVPKTLSEEEAKHILGAQGNVWTEYIRTPEHVEYMALPRMLALAEVLWTPKEKRDEADFISRLEAEFPKLEELGVNASESMFQVRLAIGPGQFPGNVMVRLIPPREGAPLALMWTVDGAWTSGAGPETFDATGLETSGSTSIQVRMVDTVGGTVVRRYPVTHISLLFNHATGRTISVNPLPHERFSSGGAFILVDGTSGSDRRVDNEWLGWKENVTITVDLGEVRDIAHIGIGTLHETCSWIHAPEQVVVMHSLDGSNYLPYAVVKRPKNAKGRTYYGEDRHAKTRYVRFRVKSAGTIPEGFPGAGNPAWLFLDEIEVR